MKPADEDQPEVVPADEEAEPLAPPKPRRARGLAAASPQTRREVSQIGARRGRWRGTVHKWTSEEAREAGRRSGEVRRAKAAAKARGG